jgi:hypothetical protein
VRAAAGGDVGNAFAAPTLLRAVTAFAVVRNLEEAFVEKGTEAAGQILAAGLPMSGGRQENGGKERIQGGEEAPQGEPGTELMEMMARPEKHMHRGGGGRGLGREPPSRATLALAERLGTWAVPFPGDHGGFGMNTEAFAAKLNEVLEVSR